MFSVMTASNLARALMRQGKLSEAEEVYQEALDLARGRQGVLLPIAGEALMGLGELNLELNRLNQAVDYLLDGIELTKDCSSSTLFTNWIAATAVLQKNVEAGKHQIKVEGIYCGYDSNTHIQSKMNFSIHRTKSTPIELSYHQSLDEDKDTCKLPSIIPVSPGNIIEVELSDQIGGEK